MELLYTRGPQFHDIGMITLHGILCQTEDLF